MRRDDTVDPDCQGVGGVEDAKIARHMHVPTVRPYRLLARTGTPRASPFHGPPLFGTFALSGMFALSGNSRHSASGALWPLAKVGISRSSALRAIRHFAPFGSSRCS